MKLSAITQQPFSQIGSTYDLCICASGYESRCRHVAERLSGLNIPVLKKTVFAFKEHTTSCSRPDNDRLFREMGFTSTLCSGRGTDDLRPLVAEALHGIQDRAGARILVDISSMTRAWYGEIVRILARLPRANDIHVDFTYVAAEFRPASEAYPPNQFVGPVPGFIGMSLPDKPTALAIGLGYHRDRAIGLKDYLDPKITVAFYANPASDTRYVEAVKQTNAQLLAEIPSENIIEYPIDDCVATYNMIDSLCEGLSRESRIVFCSLGPKVFGLSCFLVASLRKDISIWHVGAGDREVPSDRKPDGEPLLLETVWKPSTD